jgi:hypothetical protein
MPRSTRRPAKPPVCADCKGNGIVTVPAMVGRGKRRRQVGGQGAMCVTCLGSGVVPTC